MKTISIYTTVMLLIIAGCQQDPSKNTNQNIYSSETQCQEPRATICTQQFSPVCSLPAHKTYSNGCMACADTKVTSYTKGACK